MDNQSLKEPDRLSLLGELALLVGQLEQLGVDFSSLVTASSGLRSATLIRVIQDLENLIEFFSKRSS